MSRRMNVAEYVRKQLAGLVVLPTVPEDSGNSPIIGTHDGNFHCDEAMACGMLRQTSDFRRACVVRSRNPVQHRLCNILVDVGSVYDPSKNLLDHHQPEFCDTMNTGVQQYRTRLSSAGLVYRHYGMHILEAYAQACVEAGAVARPPTKQELALVYDRLYRGFVEHVDGIDNGVEEFSLDSSTAGEGSERQSSVLKRNYTVPTTLSARVGGLFPRWNEDHARKDEDDAFVQAVHLATTELMEAMDHYLCSWLPARSLVEGAIEQASQHHESLKIIVLPAAGCPWKEHLLDIEKERGCLGRTIYVLFSDGKGWRVQCVPLENSSFQNRKPLPWKGLRDEALSEASGIDGGVFVHASGFIGGNKTFEGALAMAVKALSM